MYPGREWDTNFAGFYNDYDPRTRPWYIAATSGPKDVVIILDCRFEVIFSLKGPIPSIFSSSFYIINKKPTMPRTDFHCITTRVAHSAG